MNRPERPPTIQCRADTLHYIYDLEAYCDRLVSISKCCRICKFEHETKQFGMFRVMCDGCKNFDKWELKDG